MKLYSIASGSSGNCIYVGHNNTHILIDTGISKKRIEEGLNNIGLTLNDITAILITHEHSDHISGLGTTLRKSEIPVYGTKGTINSILNDKKIGKVNTELFNSINVDNKFSINDIEVSPFSISHDAKEPCAYRFDANNKSVAIATDMGCYNDYIISNLTGLNGLLIEANHDIRMLQMGSYPYVLKQRILSSQGHLCNEHCGRLIDNILNDKMKHIFLGHLSHENNYPQLAYESVRMEINLSDSKYKADDFEIEVASRITPSKLIEF